MGFGVAAARPSSVRESTRDRELKIVLASWAPFYAGAEVAVERLAVGLQDDGHKVTVLLGTDGETLERMQAAGLDARFVPLALTDKLKWWRYRRAQRELRRILMELRPDVVHANDLPTSQMVSQAAGQLGIPRVCHHRWVFGGAAIDWLNKFGAERHVFVSQALMNQLCRASARLAATDAAVVYDGLPLPAVPTDADRREARRELNLPLDKLVVLFAGQIIERKGVEDLLRAWTMLSNTSSESSELILVGDDLENNGQSLRQMRSHAAELNCPARFTGFQRNVSRWLAAADVCVVPSHVEPLGNATLEAMAHARPVVGTNVGGIPEMIVDGETGLLVPPHDPQRLAASIQSLFQDAELRLRLGCEGRIRCEERFSLRAHVDAILDQYHSVIARHAVANA